MNAYGEEQNWKHFVFLKRPTKKEIWTKDVLNRGLS